MVVKMRKLLGFVSLTSLLACAAAASAQTGRVWVDPPAEGAAQPQKPRPSEQVAPAQHSNSVKPAPSSPEQTASGGDKASSSHDSQTGKSSAQVETRQPAAEPEQKATAKREALRRTAIARRARASSQETASAKDVQRRALAARLNSVRSTGSIQTSAPESRRGTRYETVQDGIDAGLEVMRLRTIQFPDGRRITILTKPDPEFLSEAADPY